MHKIDITRNEDISTVQMCDLIKNHTVWKLQKITKN
jgi:hypothetical protein